MKKKEKAEAWNKASKTVMKYSDEMVDQWNKEIDGLLTFVRFSCNSLTVPRANSLNRPVCSRPF